MPELPERKSKIRNAMLTRMQDTGLAKALKNGEKILARLTEKLPWDKYGSIALFRSLPGEVDTAPLEKFLRDQGKVLLYPRVDSLQKDIEMAAMAEGDRFSRGPHGTAQPPPHHPAVGPERIDLVLAPGLAFDRKGNRLGRGLGFYDRWLRGFRGLRVGLAHGFQLLAEVPSGCDDEKVDVIVTEMEFWRVTK